MKNSMKKKRIAFMAAAACLILLGIVFCLNETVKSSNVTCVENTFSGDIKEAEGLNIKSSTYFKERTKWDTEISFKDGTFGALTKNSYGRLSKEMYKEMGWISFDLEGDLWMNLHNKFEKKAKEKKKIVISVKDYRKYYDVEYRLYDSSEKDYVDIREGSKLYDQLTEFFRIPVGDSKVIYEIVDEDGSEETEVEGIDYFSLTETAGCGKRYLYVENADKEEKELMDNSLIPGGYGLYEYTIKGDDLSIRNIYAPAKDELINGVSESEDGSDLIVTTVNGSKLKAYIIDPETGREKQMIDLGYDDAGNYSGYIDGPVICKDNGSVCILSGRAMTVLVKEKNRYVKKIDYHFPDDTTMKIYFTTNTAYAFDGEKAAVAGLKRSGDVEEQDCEESCGFNLAVVDNTGLLYNGGFTSDLDTAFEIDEDFWTEDLVNHVKLELRWDK